MSQYKYDLTNHLANPIDMDIPENDEDGNALDGWEHVENSIETVTVIADLEEFDSVASQQVFSKCKAQSVLSLS
mgnify:CR=1 FL=1